MYTSAKRAAAACALLAGASSIALTAMPAAAQSPVTQPTPPRDHSLDVNGVDLVTGKLYLSSTDLTIGSGDAGLSYSRSQRALGYDDEYQTALNVGDNSITVAIGSESDTFGLEGGNSTSGTGAMLSQVNGQYLYTTRGGVLYVFSGTVRSERYRVAQQRAIGIKYPNGRELSIEYNFSYYDAVCDEFTPCGPSFAISRPSAVSSNDGFRMLFRYLSDSFDVGAGSGASVERYMTLAGVTVTNAAEQHCTESSCPPGGSTWASAQYAWNASSSEETRTDPLGRTTVTTVDSAGRITSLRLPGETSNAATITYDSAGRVATFATGVGTWTYAYVDAGAVRTTTVTSPTGLQRVTESDLAKGKVTNDRTGSGGTTTYDYDNETRLIKMTAPEGNFTTYGYDAQDNVTSTTSTSKDGIATLSTSASFPADCSNLLNCHKPLAITDAKGQVTNYEYDPVHGGVLSIKRPRPTPNAARPEIRFSYQQLYAWYKAASDALIQATNPIWKLVAVSECASGEVPACIGTAAETRTEIAYGAPGTPNNLLPTSITVRAGDNSVSSTRTMTYDRHGNLVAEDGPLPSASDTSVARYNLARELVGTISPDPDGGGPLKHRAVRIGRDLMGRVTTTEAGTVDGPSDAQWNAFSSLQIGITSYNPVTRLKTQDALIAGGSTRRLVQYGYDADGRTSCTVVRIGRAAASDPCQQLGDAASGYDQLAETIYGPDGRVLKTREGGIDTATVTYTLNGQVASLTDGESNRSSYDYDGFDRAYRMSYPVAAKGADASIVVGLDGSGDYEQLGYDANGNVTSRRVRDGTVLGYQYDALNRRTFDDNPNTNVAEVDVGYFYDNLDRLLSVGDGNGWHNSFEYDALGRVKRQHSNVSSNTLQYDNAGRLTRQTWADDFYVTTEYLTTGETRVMRENGDLALATFAYDDLGRRTSLTRGNGTVTTYGYDAGSDLTGLVHDLAGGTQDLTLGLGHDGLGRITSRTSSNEAYSFAGALNGTKSYVANGLNQYTQAGAVTPTYDGRGNTTSAAGQSYTYNTRNQLFQNGAGQLFYRNPIGLLGQGDGTSSDYVGSRLTTEFSGGVVRRYVHGPGTDEPLVWYEGAGTSDRRYLHADERGSVVAATNDAGAAIGINTYDEHGRPGTGNIGRFQYTGQRWVAPLGLYDYKARMYSPTLGRFMQTDPIGYADGMNLHAYVRGDPVNYTDPTGLKQTTGECLAARAAEIASGSDLIIVCGGGGGGGGGFGGGGFGGGGFRGGGFGGGGFGGGGGRGGTAPAPAPTPPQKVAKLNSCQASFAASQLAARGLPTSHLGDVRFKEGSAGGGMAASFALWRGNPAITRGSNVYVASSAWGAVTNPRNPAGTMWAEVAHTAQYASSSNAGFVSEYVAGVIGGVLTGEGGWGGNIMEVTAHRIGAEMAAAWKNGGAKTCK